MLMVKQPLLFFCSFVRLYDSLHTYHRSFGSNHKLLCTYRTPFKITLYLSIVPSVVIPAMFIFVYALLPVSYHIQCGVILVIIGILGHVHT